MKTTETVMKKFLGKIQFLKILQNFQKNIVFPFAFWKVFKSAM